VAKNSNFYPVILAGGRGTRFWPLSRKKHAKQLLALDGKQTMIQQTVERLLPLASPSRFWIITNDDLRPAILKQLPKLPKAQVIAEPIGRNTAPAIGLAAFILLRQHPDAVIGMFPSDHVIADENKYRSTIERGAEIAAGGEHIVVLGIRPNRAETGYGYIEAGGAFSRDALRVRRFTEKPDAEKAAAFVAAGNYFWNSGMFLWSPRTLANALREYLPKTASLLEEIAGSFGTRRFAATFRKIYPKCENISIDYAVLEPRSAKGEAQNVGVNDLVVVDTPDALLITTRQNAQDVGKVVKYLDGKKLHRLT
jgi:mannose-1-phosphate guanylyltransferase